MTTLPSITLHATPRLGRIMLVIAPHPHRGGDFGAVVAGEDHQRVIGDSQSLALIDKFSHDVVQLD